MAGMSRTSEEDLKAQLCEYHVVVSEVIGGMSADILEIQKKICQLEKQNGELIKTLRELEATSRLLVQKVMSSN